MEFHIDSVSSLLFRELSSFGALPFFVFVILLLFAHGDTFFALRLCGFLLLAYAVCILIRFLYFKERPNKESYRNVIEKIDSSSFPSLHAVRAVGLGLFFSEYFAIIHITFLLFVFVFLVCVSRIFLQKHDLWDVLAGAALGILLFFVF